MSVQASEADIEFWLPTTRGRLAESGFLTSKQLTSMLGVSNRKLQWWHESKVVVPRVESHLRLYDQEDALIVAAISQLNAQSVSLKAIRRFLRPLKKALAQRPLPEYLVVGDKDVVPCTEEKVASVASAIGKVRVISVGSLVKKLKKED
jgi:DNA-binding transcriptional MerR regulator